MSFLDDIATNVEHEDLLRQRAGVIRIESAGAQNYLKFYRRAILPVSIMSLFLPLFALPASIWAEECAGLHDNSKGMQILGQRYKRPWAIYMQYALLGRRGLAAAFPGIAVGGVIAFFGFGKLLTAGGIDIGGAWEAYVPELWAIANAWYVIANYGKAKRAAQAANAAADYVQQKGN